MKVFLSTGSNQGDRLRNLATAGQLISEKAATIRTASGIYETAAWGITDQPLFLNQVLEVETELPADKLLKTILGLEKEMGRVRREKWGPRIIDIDILFYESQIIAEPDLTVPHPGIPDRKFILVPLHEIAPEFIHPVLKRSVQELLAECKDPLEVRLLD